MATTTTIKLHESTKEKLDAYKASNGNITYDDVIQSLLRKVGGVIVDDVHEIKREQVALFINATGYDADGNRIEFEKRPITFLELANSKVGDTFESKEFNLVNEVREVAEVVMKTDVDVFIRIVSFNYSEEGVWEEYYLFHVVLF